MIIIANWKQNKTLPELKPWIDTFHGALDKTDLEKVQIVVAPSTIFIVPFKMISNEFSYYLKLASQNVSNFENGAHTGETGAEQLVDLVEYAIIGHSERRASGESLEDVNLKVEQALKIGIKPVVCFSTEEQFSSVKSQFKDAEIKFAYEPASAISTAVNSTGPASADDVKQMVEKLGLKSVIYGGSVDENSVINYLNLPFIEGFLVGSASLDPIRFAKIVSKSS